MPEEHNRVLTDHAADLLFCPTRTAVEHLVNEGITRGVYQTGDVMYDAVLFNSELAEKRVDPLGQHQLTPQHYYLATLHRPYNTDHPQNLAGILAAFEQFDQPILFPIHPRTRKYLDQYGLQPGPNIRLIEPVGYLEMLVLEKNAKAIVTDSGGVQKEAYFFAVPCITIRPETEWIETVEAGWNTLAASEPQSILAGLIRLPPTTSPPLVFGDGQAAPHIAHHLAAQ
jgi:UDP-N-acetylglucosamine 2-epimerase